ncbi:MAG: hypothetical protein M3367_03210 [Acidobacteriota bacterium]|nr:hypothetical protein [Acidobacteriota bacterium]
MNIGYAMDEASRAAGVRMFIFGFFAGIGFCFLAWLIWYLWNHIQISLR